jgi:hypothetical protein
VLRLSIRILAALALASAFFSAPCAAASYELAVYGDDLPDPGEGELETVFSYAKPRPDDDLRASHVGQAQLELGYGLSSEWAVGLEIPAAFAGRTHKIQGASLELQYVAPRDASQGGYAGLRVEAGREASVYENEVENEVENAVELNPILGYRWGRLHAILDPSFELPVHADDSRARFQPSTKATWQLARHGDVGVEYYGDWGPAHALLPRARRSETVYAVWDDRIAHCNVNAGIGHGLHPETGTADRWVAKLALEFELD